MADLSIVIVGGEAGGILTGCSAAEFLRHERADDLLEAVIDFFFRNMIGHLNVKDDLTFFMDVRIPSSVCAVTISDVKHLSSGICTLLHFSLQC